MAFRDYWNELLGAVKGLSPLLAQKLVNRAWEDIRGARLWSFLVSDGYLIAPAVIAAGTVTVTRLGTTVVGDATAAAAWQAAASETPPLIGVAGTGRQFRLSGGPLYSITAFNGTNTITLDRPYLESSGAGLSYEIYRAYYSPPATDFLRYLSLTNVQQGYTIRGEKLYMSGEQLNRSDPQRASKGDAYRVVHYKADTSGRPIHELWPHPTTLAPYMAWYQRRGVDLSDTVDLPAVIPVSLLMCRALQYAYEWAAGQPQLAKVAQWPTLVAAQRIQYLGRRGEPGLLMQAIRNDEEIMPTLPTGTPEKYDVPMDGNWLQQHDVARLL